MSVGKFASEIKAIINYIYAVDFDHNLKRSNHNPSYQDGNLEI